MFPVILNIGSFTISSLGLMFSIAFFIGSFKIWQKMKEEHHEDNETFDLIFLSFFGGLILARLIYIFLNFNLFSFDLGKWINLAYSNNFSWLGFLLGLMWVVKVFSKKKKWDFWEILDFSVYGVVVGQIFVYVGKFLDCSFYGSVTNLPWGISIPGVEGMRHPISFYKTIILIFTLFVIKWLDKRYRLFVWYQNKRGKANPGFLWLSYLLIFAVFEFIFDVLMDSVRILGPFSSYQILLILFIFFVGFSFWLRAGNEFNLIDDDKSKDNLKVIRPASKNPVRTVEKREAKKKRFSRTKAGRDYK